MNDEIHNFTNKDVALTSGEQLERLDFFGDASSKVYDKDKELIGKKLTKNDEGRASIADDVGESEIFFRKPEDSIQFGSEEAAESVEIKQQTVIENTLEFTDDETDAGFQASKVEFINVPKWKSEELGKETEKDYIQLKQASAVSVVGDVLKYWVLKTKFERGTLVQALDSQKKPLFLMLQVETSLMAYKYLGDSLKIEIPDSVGKLPVKYLHPDFLNGVKLRSFKSNFNVNNLADASKETFKTSFAGVQSIRLPNGLKMLPPKVFYHCTALEELIIPASVSAVSVDTFTGCCLRDIWFNGPCPLGFKNNVMLLDKVRIHYKKEFAESFRGDLL